MDDEDIKIPRGPLTRHDWGLLGLTVIMVSCMLTLLASLIFG